MAPNGEISRLIEAALTSTASDALPEPLLASLRKEIIGKSSLARSNQLVATYIAARRETTKRCHAAKEMGAPEEEVRGVQPPRPRFLPANLCLVASDSSVASDDFETELRYFRPSRRHLSHGP